MYVRPNSGLRQKTKRIFALPRSTDIGRPARLIRFVPKTEVRGSFDYLIGANEYVGRHRDAKDFRGFQINCQLELEFRAGTLGRLGQYDLSQLKAEQSESVAA
jgi:hypothetical protein